MTADGRGLDVELGGFDDDVESVVDTYLEIQGWKKLLALLMRLAEKRSEGRMAGILQAAVNFLSEKG
jgi:hypothetical protein